MESWNIRVHYHDPSILTRTSGIVTSHSGTTTGFWVCTWCVPVHTGMYLYVLVYTKHQSTYRYVLQSIEARRGVDPRLAPRASRFARLGSLTLFAVSRDADRDTECTDRSEMNLGF